MHDTVDFVMTEHAAWQQADGCVQRVFALDTGRWLATLHDGKLTLDRLSGTGAEPVRDVFTLPKGFRAALPSWQPRCVLWVQLCASATRTLWDTIGTSIIRQLIRAGQSKKLYRAFCQAHGEQVGLPNGTTNALFPAPEIVLGLSDDQFSSLGRAFKRRPLKAAAEAYLEHGAKWRELAPDTLIADALPLRRSRGAHLGQASCTLTRLAS